MRTLSDKAPAFYRVPAELFLRILEHIDSPRLKLLRVSASPAWADAVRATLYATLEVRTVNSWRDGDKLELFIWRSSHAAFMLEHPELHRWIRTLRVRVSQEHFSAWSVSRSRGGRVFGPVKDDDAIVPLNGFVEDLTNLSAMHGPLCRPWEVEQNSICSTRVDEVPLLLCEMDANRRVTFDVSPRTLEKYPRSVAGVLNYIVLRTSNISELHFGATTNSEMQMREHDDERQSMHRMFRAFTNNLDKIIAALGAHAQTIKAFSLPEAPRYKDKELRNRFDAALNGTSL